MGSAHASDGGGANVVIAGACDEPGSNIEAIAPIIQDWMTDASAGDYLAAVAGTTVTDRSYSFIKMDEHPDAENTTIGQFCMRGRAYMCGWSPEITGAKCLGPATSAIHQGFTLNETDGEREHDAGLLRSQLLF